MNFRVIENNDEDMYLEWVELYNQGMLIKEINEKLGLSDYMYRKYRREALKSGLIKDRRKTYEPKYYYKTSKGYYSVNHRNEKGVMQYYGLYKTEKEAKKKVEELKKNNWRG